MSFTKVIMNPTVQGLDRLQCCTLICTSYFFENQLVELIMWRLYIKLDAWATTIYGAIMAPMPSFVVPMAPQKWHHKLTMAPHGDIVHHWCHRMAPIMAPLAPFCGTIWNFFMSAIKVWHSMVPQTVCGAIKWPIAQMVEPMVPYGAIWHHWHHFVVPLPMAP